MKIFLITEGSNTAGFGHLERCKAIYQAFEEKGMTPQFIFNGDKTAAELLRDKKHVIFDWLKEKERLFEMIKDSDITFVDSYQADKLFYEDVSALSGTPVYLDDNNRMDYPKGIVLNGTIFAEEMDYKRSRDKTYLLGTKYIPIRKDLWEVPEKEIKENLECVMVTFGSSDVRNSTPGIMKVLVSNYPELRKKIVVGKGFQNIDEIKRLSDSKTELIYFPDAKGMKRVMMDSDIAISAGGQTQYELARTGVPALVIAVADNQLDNVEGWKRTGFIEYAGWWEDENVLNNIEDSIYKFKDAGIRRHKSEIGKRYVDGRGASRIADFVVGRS